MSDLDIVHARLQARQERAFEWALKTYGERVRSTRYQALRLVEEVFELVQTQGLSLEDLSRVGSYVYARRLGDTKVEIGDVALSLDIMAENLGLSVDSCHTSCLLRIQGLDPDKARAKDDAKIASGLI